MHEDVEGACIELLLPGVDVPPMAYSDRGWQAMKRRIEELKESAFTPVRCTGCDDGFGNIACGPKNCHDARACEVAMGERAFPATPCRIHSVYV